MQDSLLLWTNRQEQVKLTHCQIEHTRSMHACILNAEQHPEFIPYMNTEHELVVFRQYSL